MINSMIDGFNASRVGCPDRRNGTGNTYFPIAWHRVGLLTKTPHGGPSCSSLWQFQHHGPDRDLEKGGLLEVVSWMDRVFIYMCSRYLRMDEDPCAGSWE